MKKISAYTLAEVMVTMVVLAFMAVLTIPSIVSGKIEKTYYKGYAKAYSTIQDVSEMYTRLPDGVYMPTHENIAKFIIYFSQKTNIKGLYAEADPKPKSQTFAALKFKDIKETAGAKNPTTISPEIEIGPTPTFWIVTDDNIAYSAIIPDKANCDEKLNLNTLPTQSDTLSHSCFAFIVDTNGIFSNPNTLETTETIANDDRLPNLKHDRYYIFMGRDGATSGNPNAILSAKVFDSKTGL